MQKVENLTKAQKHGSDFVNVVSYDDLRVNRSSTFCPIWARS